MDRNIAAFLRDDSYSVRVLFQQSMNQANAKQFWYVTNIPGLEIDDYVIVPYKPSDGPERWSIAIVAEVVTELAIEPNSDIQYKWVAQKLDFTDYEKLATQNTELQVRLNQAYRSNMKRNFAQNMLLGLDP